MLRKILTLTLILLAVGFYFWPDSTKDIVDSTGYAIKETAKNTLEEIKQDEKLKEGVNSIKSDIKNRINDNGSIDNKSESQNG